MKKITLFAFIGLIAISCKKWENQSTEFKITGLWTGVNQEFQIQALPFLDSNEVTPTPYTEANFRDDGSLVIDSAGVELDSLGWFVKHDSILVLSGLDLGFENPLSGGSLIPNDLEFSILRLTQEELTLRYDTTLSLTIPGIPFGVNVTVKQIQRWAK